MRPRPILWRPLLTVDHWCLMGLKKLVSWPMQSTRAPRRSAILATWLSSMRSSSESRPRARTTSGSSQTKRWKGAICLSRSENSKTRTLSWRPTASHSWMVARLSCVSSSTATISNRSSMFASTRRICRPMMIRSHRKSFLVSPTLVWGSMSAGPTLSVPSISLRILARIACAFASSCFACARAACFSTTREGTCGGSSACVQSSSPWASLPRSRCQRSRLQRVAEQDSLRTLSMSTVRSSRR
mmetsp:Transcript_97297/g.275302  ORF Transcript_97297/g.275302 Transcript_97297/m.275302 type:complete len:243 (+) Transcript_97297:591-1319(+)